MKSTFADRLKTIMTIRGKKQTDVVRDTGIPKSALSQYTKGKFIAKNDRLTTLAKYFDVSEVWLQGYNVPMGHYDSKEGLRRFFLIETKLNSIGYKIGFDEDDAIMWLEYPDGTLEISNEDLYELDEKTDEFLKFSLQELKNKRIGDFKNLDGVRVAADPAAAATQKVGIKASEKSSPSIAAAAANIIVKNSEKHSAKDWAAVPTSHEPDERFKGVCSVRSGNSFSESNNINIMPDRPAASVKSSLGLGKK